MNPNSQAFPTPAGDYGLSIRAHFAVQVLSAVYESNIGYVDTTPEKMAAIACSLADALILELSKPTNP